MTSKFSVGDTVKLKSGGPGMTVADFPTSTAGGLTSKYRCIWFKGASSEYGYFEEETLILHVAPTTS